jgi:hypothetical protein
VTDDWGREIAEVRGEVRALTGRVSKVEKWVEKDSPEFHRKMESFVNRYEGAEEMREKLAKQRHLENSDRLNRIEVEAARGTSRSTFWGVIVAFLMLLTTIFMAFVAYKAATHAEVSPANYFHTSSPNPVYADTNKQDTGLPPSYQMK